MENNGFIKHQDDVEKVIAWLCDEFKKNDGIDLRQDKMAFLRLKGAVEKAKIELSAGDD